MFVAKDEQGNRADHGDWTRRNRQQEASES